MKKYWSIIFVGIFIILFCLISYFEDPRPHLQKVEPFTMSEASNLINYPEIDKEFVREMKALIEKEEAQRAEWCELQDQARLSYDDFASCKAVTK